MLSRWRRENADGFGGMLCDGANETSFLRNAVNFSPWTVRRPLPASRHAGPGLPDGPHENLWFTDHPPADAPVSVRNLPLKPFAVKYPFFMPKGTKFLIFFAENILSMYCTKHRMGIYATLPSLVLAFPQKKRLPLQAQLQREAWVRYFVLGIFSLSVLCGFLPAPIS